MGKATKILAQNLNRLIGPGKRFSSNEAAAEASGIGRSTIDRARKAEVALRLDSLTELARAAKIETWQLLVPGFDPERLPLIEPHAPEGVWPLTGVDPDAFSRIPTDEKEEVIALARSKVARYGKTGKPSNEGIPDIVKHSNQGDTLLQNLEREVSELKQDATRAPRSRRPQYR